jgi:hypothetical protein
MYRYPPGWGETPRTDQKECGFVFILDQPISIHADPSSEIEMSVRGLRVLEASGDPLQQQIETAQEQRGGQSEVEILSGCHVTATGKLEVMIAGHHLSPVRLEITSLGEINCRQNWPAHC